MKTIINKLRYMLLLGFIAMMAFGDSLNAATLQVCQGTNTNNYIPMWLYRFDDYLQTQQMIYPSSMLTQMEGKQITSLTFYANGNFDRVSGGVIEVSLGTTSSATFTSNALITTGLTKKATFEMNSTVISGSQLTITLDSPYEYNGGNLVIQFNKTTNGNSYQYDSFAFYGVNQSGYTSIYTYKSSANGSWSTTRQQFLPRLTFGYEDVQPKIEANPGTVNYNTEPGTPQTLAVAVTGENLTGNITATISDANGVFSFSPNSIVATTTLNSSGGTLNITYSPSAEGTHNATVTLSGGGATAVTVILNGTCEIKTDATICDGSGGLTTSAQAILPVYGWYFDAYQHNQMLYPASKFTNTSMNGKKITKITFFPTTSGSYSGINFYDDNTGEATVTIKLANMPANTTGYAASTSLKDADFKVVKTITMPTSPQSNLTEWIFENLENEFVYDGGDLLIDVTTDLGYAGRTYFVCETQGSGNYPSCYSYSGAYNKTPTGLEYLPKVKFEFEESTPITNGTVTPNAVDFGNVVVGESATQTVTITNTGNQPFTPVIDATSLPAGVSVSTASQIAAGGNLPLTVTFAPTADGAVSGSFTVTIPVPDGEDLTFTVTVTGTGYIISSTLTSQTVVVPVYKSDIQAPSRTYVFSREDVENDTLRTLNYSDDAKIQTQVLVKNEEPVVSYDLHRKAGSGNWTYPGGNAVAQAVQQSSPSTYLVDQETFTIPQDATQLWVPMTDEGVDASSELLYVPVTVADGVASTGNTYGAPQVAATNDGLTITFEVTGSKSAGGVGGNWDQTLPDGTTENYCVYSPVITITSVDPAFGINTRLPYMFRAWLLVDDSNIYYYDIKRVPNTNDPTHGHIVADSLITQPKLLGTLPGTPDMVGNGQFGPIGYEWTEDGPISPSGNVKP